MLEQHDLILYRKTVTRGYNCKARTMKLKLWGVAQITQDVQALL